MGHKFVLQTDHKPLTAIFGEKRGIPPIAAARMQRWAIILSAYQYEIQFVKGNSISHADALSRIPLPETVEEVSCFSMCDEFNHFIYFFSAVESAPLTAKEIAVATQEDPVLRQVLHFFYTSLSMVGRNYSKWVEVFLMNKTTAEHTITKLRTLFSSYGLPELVVSDNGPQFACEEFSDFLKRNGIRQALIPPYHPASNGAAEKTVQTKYATRNHQEIPSRDVLGQEAAHPAVPDSAQHGGKCRNHGPEAASLFHSRRDSLRQKRPRRKGEMLPWKNHPPEE
ncbi:hypothetical protein JTE90_009871 [Oedothorax gibbosus]|uniref:Integrase catalytic domain-containing protein n=1 Tax=Oedothorax gibbosus TaxID=931172 RepID=A0AAV6UUI8_9ARAC|nr:hypothetical protein JTE90_009871 [Oedothorax gibbosus]